eukprot:11350190-Alexandrium_andersonii.AAC.1
MPSGRLTDWSGGSKLSTVRALSRRRSTGRPLPSGPLLATAGNLAAQAAGAYPELGAYATVGQDQVSRCDVEGLLGLISELSRLDARDELQRLASAGLDGNDQAICKAMRWAPL